MSEPASTQDNLYNSEGRLLQPLIHPIRENRPVWISHIRPEPLPYGSVNVSAHLLNTPGKEYTV